MEEKKENNENKNDVKFFPAWKEAVEVFIKEGCEPGRVLTREWFDTQFNLKKPVTAEDQKQYQLDFLAAFKPFERTLLREYQIALKTDYAGGYVVLPPNQQAEWAERNALNKVGNALKQGLDRVVNTNTAALNDDERRAHSDSLARLSWVRDAVASKKKIVTQRKKLLDMDLEQDV